MTDTTCDMLDEALKEIDEKRLLEMQKTRDAYAEAMEKTLLALATSIENAKAALDACTKPKKWEPRGRKYFISGWGEVLPGRHVTYNAGTWTCFGMSRENLECANRDAELIGKFARMLAWREEFGDENSPRLPVSEEGWKMIASKFMSADEFTKFCEMTHSGEVEL